ncbi:MAG: hypothetical protein J2P18_22020 [Nocardia sp.]|nr:hypothetical protein [Nocardia sp.]
MEGSGAPALDRGARGCGGSDLDCEERRRCVRIAALCAAAERNLRELRDTVSALHDYIADATTAGCRVAPDWTVSGERAEIVSQWSEVIAEAVATVRGSEQRSRTAIRAVGAALLEVSRVFAREYPAGAGNLPNGSALPERP